MLASVEKAEYRRDEAAAHRGRLGGPALAALVLLLGLGTSLLIVAGLRVDQRNNAEQVMDQRTAVALAAVQAETERYRGLLEAIAAGIATDEVFTWDDFDVATAPLASAELAGAPSVGFIVPARTAEIPTTQRLWRGRGADGLLLRPSVGAREHFFSIFSRQLGATDAPVGGVDAAASTQASEALGEARRTHQTTVSDTYVLLRDRHLAPERQQHSFVFVAPIWTRAPFPVFRGWIVLGLRSQEFLSGVLRTVGQGQLDGRLVAVNRDGSRAVVAEYAAPGRLSLRRTNDFPVAGRQWTLVTGADPARLPGAYSVLPLAVLVGCLAISAILAGLVYVLATGRARAWKRVQQATAEIRQAEMESARQAGLLRAIMDSIGDGVGVVDETGAFLLHNPAAKALLGIGEDIDDPNAWQQHYGLYRPDGRTPFPLEELPLMRALAGHPSDGVEMIVRNPERPDGILISVDGRPLDPSAGQRGAVAVFHDITELRRYENDLTVFAGVVAHDLKAPLAVVRAHCESAVDDLGEAQDAKPVRDARGALVRVVRAVDRMAGLIDTLLAYCTARDAPMRVRPVELGPLVAEVVHDRTAHLPGDRLPDIRIGPLPVVRADPAMLRHVLDNLLGNALKYVRSGATPRIDVTAAAAPQGRVRIEIADRGIGIPEADKPDVFETFHRATTAVGYAGTGLGLAICKRIVQRHDGEIGVQDNPGGGTRFFFTLPAATGAEQKAARGDEMTVDGRSADDAALDRALAERADVENAYRPDLAPHPAAGPATHQDQATPGRAPVPGHPRGE